MDWEKLIAAIAAGIATVIGSIGALLGIKKNKECCEHKKAKKKKEKAHGKPKG